MHKPSHISPEHEEFLRKSAPLANSALPSRKFFFFYLITEKNSENTGILNGLELKFGTHAKRVELFDGKSIQLKVCHEWSRGFAAKYWIESKMLEQISDRNIPNTIKLALTFVVR